MLQITARSVYNELISSRRSAGCRRQRQLRSLRRRIGYCYRCRIKRGSGVARLAVNAKRNRPRKAARRCHGHCIYCAGRWVHSLCRWADVQRKIGSRSGVGNLRDKRVCRAAAICPLKGRYSRKIRSGGQACDECVVRRIKSYVSRKCGRARKVLVSAPAKIRRVNKDIARRAKLRDECVRAAAARKLKRRSGWEIG